MLYKLKESVVIQDIGYGEDIMVYDIEKGILHFVNTSAAEILKTIEEAISIDKIAAKLSQEYDIEIEILKKDVQDILNEFVEKDLVDVLAV